MQITPISFAGRKEVVAIARKSGKLNKNEEKLVDNALAFHSIEINDSSDGAYYFSKDAGKKVDAFIDSLDKAGASKLSFMIAADALKSKHLDPRDFGHERCKVQERLLNIARKANDVTKEDVLENIKLFG
ncbi:MAG: hypothetical protein E7Z91_06310 [Cyanobacteria bacterium SIG30]|nr:hypothetical protein [Cyanobacteria bacterium SIG30]